MRIDIITIFPEYFGPLRVSLIGKAADRGDITFGVHDLRSWTYDVHHSVDDTPFGGGPGMVMKPEPWGAALDALAGDPGAGVAVGPGHDPLLIVPTPSGVPFTQQHAVAYAAEPWLIFACGRYEGIDGRVIDEARTRMRVAEVSLGDYVLAGGEPAVLVMTEAICSHRCRGPRERRVGRGRLLRRGRRPDGRPGRGPGVHPAQGLAGPRGAPRSALR